MKQQKLPSGWLRKPLAELIEPRSEKVIPLEYGDMPFLGMDHVEPHTAKILGSVPSQKMKSRAAKFYPNDVLYGRLRPYLNKVTSPSFEGLASAEFIVFPRNKLFNSKFLRYRLSARDFVSFANHLNEGDRPRVNFDQIGVFNFDLPPLNEQHRIVAKIEELFSELDKGIESLKTAREQLKVSRQSLLKHAFEGKLTEQWRKDNADHLETADELLERIKQEREARYQQQLDDWKAAVKQWEIDGKEGKKPSKPSKTKDVARISVDELVSFSKLPDQWIWLKYGDLCSKVRNGISKKPSGAEGEKIFRISAVRPMQFNMIDYRFIENSNGQFDGYLLHAGDLVFTRYNGSRQYVGVCAEYKSEKRFLFPDKLVQTRPDLPSLLSSFLEKAINSGTSRKFIESKIRTTAGQSGVSGSDIKNIPIPICSFEEQNEIVKTLEASLSIIEQKESVIDESLKKSEALRQSILKKAFSGQLVAQDPNDEPASVLLERIAQEKQQAAAKAKPTKKKKSPAKPKSAAKVLPFKQTIQGINTTDLHAGILALAYQHYAGSDSAKHFGHVKGEKIAHLVEAHLAINLDRNPIKDAAGPNDYHHLKKVESRAAKAGYFGVTRVGKRYQLEPYRQFDKLLDKTRTALGQRLNDIEALLALLKPMDTRQTEIVATLYAAWNNLLLDGSQADDEAIVTEARENWHQEKLKIDRDRFFKALQWMRDNKLTPQGKGEKVMAKVVKH